MRLISLDLTHLSQMDLPTRISRTCPFSSFMPRLHLPYDEYTMPVQCPNHRFRAASAGRPCDHRTDLRASWPLRFCLTPYSPRVFLAILAQIP